MKWLYCDNQDDIQRLQAQLAKECAADQGAFVQKYAEYFTTPKSRQLGHELMDYPHSDEGIQSLALFRPMAADMLIRQRIEKDYDLPFEKAFHAEQQQRSLQINALTRHLQRQNFHQFDYEPQFVEFGIGSGRLIKASPIIVPFHDYKLIDYSPTSKLPWMVVGENVDLRSCSYNFGFIERAAKDRRGKDKKLWIPTIHLAPALLEAVDHALKQREDANLRRSCERMMQGFRTIFSLSMHDYVHHGTYGFPAPQTYSKPRGSFVMGCEIPMAEKQNHRRRTARFNMSFDGISQPLEQNKTDPTDVPHAHEMTSIEFHAELLHRGMWKTLISENPKIEDNALRIGAQFIEDLRVFHDHCAERLGKEKASELSAYLLTIAMSRFLRLFDVDNAKLWEQPLRLQSGTKTFVQACNEANLTKCQYNHKAFAILHRNLKPVLPHPGESLSEAEKWRPVFFEQLARNPEMPNLCRFKDYAEGMSFPPEPIVLRGFEAAVARGSLRYYPRIYRAAALCNYHVNDPRFSAEKTMAKHQDTFKNFLEKGNVSTTHHEAMQGYHDYVNEVLEKNLEERNRQAARCELRRS